MAANNETNNIQPEKKMRKVLFWIAGYLSLFAIVWTEKGMSPALVAVPFLLTFQVNTFLVFNLREFASGVLKLKTLHLATAFIALFVNGYILYRLWDNVIFYSILWALPLLVYLSAKFFLFIFGNKETVNS